MSADDSVIQGLVHLMVVNGPVKRKTHGRYPTFGASPKIDADEHLRLETPGGLIARFTDDGIEKGFPALHVSRGLVEYQATVDQLLDDEEAPVVFRNRGNGDFRLGGRHAAIIAAGGSAAAAGDSQTLIYSAGVPDRV